MPTEGDLSFKKETLLFLIEGDTLVFVKDEIVFEEEGKDEIVFEEEEGKEGKDEIVFEGEEAIFFTEEVILNEGKRDVDEVEKAVLESGRIWDWEDELMAVLGILLEERENVSEEDEGDTWEDDSAALSAGKRDAFDLREEEGALESAVILNEGKREVGVTVLEAWKGEGDTTGEGEEISLLKGEGAAEVDTKRFLTECGVKSESIDSFLRL